MTADTDQPTLAVTEKPVWRCYHCGDVFTDDRCARLHFGRDEDSTPACQIKAGAEQGLLGALRDAEYAAADAQAAIANECTEVARAYYAQATRHNQALRNAEELGYERGLADARTTPEPRPAGEADVERVAKAIYDATHAGLSNCYAWDDEWEPHQEAGRGRYYTEARAAIPAALATDSAAPMAGEVAIWSGEHRAYWRRGSRGEGANYTLNLDEAGIWSRSDAIRLTSHCGPEKLIALHDRPAAHPSTQEGSK